MPGIALPGIAAAADLAVPPPAPNWVPAADAYPGRYTPGASEWIVTLGGEARAVPAWPGAPTSLYQFTGNPLMSIRSVDSAPTYFGAKDSFGVQLYSIGGFRVGAAFNYVSPRYSSQYSQLAGLSNVNMAGQAGGYAEYWAVPWLRLRGEVRQGFFGETGVTGNLLLDAVVPVGNWRFDGGPRLTAQTTQAIAPYFNTPATWPLGAYSATGGFYSYGAGGQVEYFWTRQWQTHAFVEWERLTGSAANSPLVTQRGSPNQLTFGVGGTYSFNMKPLW